MLITFDKNVKLRKIGKMIHHIKWFFLLHHVVPPQKTTWTLSLYGGLIRNRVSAPDTQ